MVRYRDVVAMVTGAGSGIGRATAERLASEGARVAVIDIDKEAAEGVAEGIGANGSKAIAVSFDVSDRDAFAQATDQVERELGPVGLLVNNAAVGGGGDVVRWDGALFARAIDVNIKSVIHGTGIVGELMRDRPGSAIVNIASMAGVLGLPGMTSYTATKGAVVSLTRATAMELAPNVRVNAVAPGKVITPFRERMFGVALTDEEIAAMAAAHPVGRVGYPPDIAAAVAFLGSSDASFITGIILNVDGGRTSGLHTRNN